MNQLITLNRIKAEIYNATKHGNITTLKVLLNDTSIKDISDHLNEFYEDVHAKCTPLMAASHYGHYEIIKFLVSNYSPNLEIEGTIQLDNQTFEGVTALWCATSAGHIDIVKILVEHGADVNHRTKNGSTPLRTACYDGHFAIVKYLVEHGADVHTTNVHGHTCLMLTAYKGHLDVLNYLYLSGCDIDAKWNCGSTALHDAAEEGHLVIVQTLLNYGAKIVKNSDQMTPIMLAAKHQQTCIIEYFTNDTKWCSQLERIESLELLGASMTDISKAYPYIYRGMQLRYFDTINPMLKHVLPPRPVFDNRTECQTLEELEQIRFNQNAMLTELLLILERILGVSNAYVLDAIRYRGAAYADSGQYDRCSALWLHALAHRGISRIDERKRELFIFTQLFCEMIYLNVNIRLEIIKQVFKYTIEELERNTTTLIQHNCQSNMDKNMYTALYLIVILTKILKENDKQVYHFISRLNRLRLSTTNGLTLLHLCVSNDITVDEFIKKKMDKFIPCASATRLLIQCGADVNMFDHERNTPLHIIAGYKKVNTDEDLQTLQTVMNLLINNGAHSDTVNIYGKTPLMCAITTQAEILLKTHRKISLKCICSTAVKALKINYYDSLPRTLYEFIEIHGTPIQ
ncbi:unnamed protein product [Didymodactylos carnosus]|uniref:Protein fem-1 homolog B n=1 Tax=Didymodactylos carnosus TaxID=1234261 RepID=A0A815P3K4_9BILA|nr:unnamed protein product [Didymodactylos carnosus]CAF4318961.1 unnamed protein product [Didymodactylos carnosus]